MLKIFKYCLVLSFVLFVTTAFSQDEEIKVKRSTEKVSIDNKLYYIHIVDKGETIYSISRAYNVTDKEIALENPEIFNGLKVGQSLKIPIIKGKNDTQELINSSADYIFHTVAEKETVYSLTKLYDVSEDDIYENNPGSKDGIGLGEVIRIPKKVVVVQKLQFEVDDERYIYHKVRRKQTLYSITKKYNVSEERIKEVNPQLRDRLPNHGETLRIPRNVIETEDIIVEMPDTIVVDSLLFPSLVDTIAKLPCDSFDYKAYNKPFNVTLMLPLFLEVNSKVEVDKVISEDQKIYPGTKFLEFYEGVLLAVDTLRKQGISINLTVIDTKKDSATIVKAITDGKLSGSDLIIGPVYAKNIDLVDEYALLNKIPLVSPLSSKRIDIKTNPYLFQAIPGFFTQLEEATKLITAFHDKNFIIVHNGSKFETDIIGIYKKKMIELLSAYKSEDEILIKEVNCKVKEIAGIDDVLSVGRENILIVPSVDQAFVSNLFRELNRKTKDYNISILGMPAWNKFGNIDLEYKHNLQLHLFKNYFVDYERDEVKDFIFKYRNHFKTEPTKYVYQGYDLTNFFLSALKNYGKQFPMCVSDFRIETLQNKLEFQKVNSAGGFENKSITIVVYDKEYNVINLDKKVEAENTTIENK